MGEKQFFANGRIILDGAKNLKLWPKNHFSTDSGLCTRTITGSVLLLAKREIASSQSLSVLPKSSMPFFWHDGPWSPLPIICFISMTKVVVLFIPFEFSVFIMYFSYWVNCFSTFPFKKPIFPKIWLLCIQIYVLSGAIWGH